MFPHHSLLAGVGKLLAQMYLMQPLACGDQWPRAGFPALLPLCGHARSQAPTC